MILDKLDPSVNGFFSGTTCDFLLQSIVSLNNVAQFVSEIIFTALTGIVFDRRSDRRRWDREHSANERFESCDFR